MVLAVSDYVLEDEAREYVNSIHIEDDPVDKYSLPEQQLQEDYESEVVVEETPAEETSVSLQSMVNTVHEAPAATVEEPMGEAPKKTYASIVCTSSITRVCGWLGGLFTCASLCVHFQMYCCTCLWPMCLCMCVSMCGFTCALACVIFPDRIFIPVGF
jgi:hypothetical protein